MKRTKLNRSQALARRRKLRQLSASMLELGAPKAVTFPKWIEKEFEYVEKVIAKAR